MSKNELNLRFDSPEDFLSAFDGEMADGGLLVPGSFAGLVRGAPCRIRLQVGEGKAFEIEAQVVAVARFGASVVFEELPEELRRLAGELRSARTKVMVPEPPAPAREPASEPTPAQKVAMALTGEREVRIQILKDQNKALHVHVLRNPRVGLDEVTWVAKTPTTSAEALLFIGEHKDWGTNPTIVSSLVRNPKTPVPLALRLLPKLNGAEIRAIARGGARDQIVQAARRMLATGG